MENIQKYCISGSADYTGKYEATNYCSMYDNQSVSVKKCTSGIERLQCCINANRHHFEHFWHKNHYFIFLFKDEWSFII